MDAPIDIGSNTWLTPQCSLLKDTRIPAHCIVAQKSVVTKKFTDEHCLIGGIPAKVVAHDIAWRAEYEHNKNHT